MKTLLRRIFRWGVLLAVLTGIVYCVTLDRQRTLLNVSHHDIGTFLVIIQFDTCGDPLAWCEPLALISGWEVTLCWRKDNGPWMQYLLDDEGSPGQWRDVSLAFGTNTVIVKKEDVMIGKLNTVDGSWEHRRYGGLVDRTPLRIVLDDNPFSDTNTIGPGSPEWDTIWPALIQQ